MSFKFHQASLQKICRICTNRLHPGVLKPSRKPQLCNTVRKEIFSVFGVSTWKDSSEEHPSSLCEKCARHVRHYQAGTRDCNPEKRGLNQTIQKDWPKHKRTGDCFVCNLVRKQGKGGGSHKAKASQSKSCDVQSPLCSFDISQENIFGHLNQHAPSCEVPYYLDILSHKGEESIFMCCVCQCILSRPAVQTPCEHNFCAVCLSACFKHSKCNDMNCPACNLIINYTQVAKSPRVLIVQLDNLVVVCSKCTKIGKLENIVHHSCDETTPPTHQKVKIVRAVESPPKNTELSTSVQIASATRILKDLAKSHQSGTPIPLEVEEVADKWTWIKLQRDKSITSLKTGGRVSN